MGIKESLKPEVKEILERYFEEMLGEGASNDITEEIINKIFNAVYENGNKKVAILDSDQTEPEYPPCEYINECVVLKNLYHKEHWKKCLEE